MIEYRTECDGWTAVWRWDNARIRIMRVATTAPGPPLIAIDTPTAAPDLVTSRERFPKLDRLWDAVRRDYWRHVCVPPRRSGGPRDEH
ncbi:hypothetical protein [Nocardia sp. CNY236]|uniref:hypothetical protein n=1 Tax=Nocardia sp. CNY236 TaxID=1169152 RepID=UPI0003F90CCE|nr:hypothetical protein [Nocardia sp. CNY236]